jgi:zinc/manganese transport system ATP-binding protein
MSPQEIHPILSFKNLTLGYNRHPAVHHLTGDVLHNDLIAIIGPNGAGKSTLLKAIMKQIKPLDGTLQVHGVKRRDMAYLPQSADIDRSFPISVYELVSTGLWRELGLFNGLRKKHHNIIHEALISVGLVGFEERPIGSLSGGQLQRALFARVLVQNSKLIVLDEPFAAIDMRTTQDLTSLIRAWHQEGRTIIAVLHDFQLVRDLFPKALLLARELIAWGATTQVLTEENLAQARAMTEAYDDHANMCSRLEIA